MVESEKIEILRVLCGSRAYGLEDEESDFDYHGVFVVPTARLLSLGAKTPTTSWLEGRDEDNTAWEIGHFLGLAIHSNPTVLETFVAPVGAANDDGLALRALFPAVVSKQAVYASFRGYAANQRKKMFEPGGGVQATDRMLKAAVSYLRSLYHGAELLRRGAYDPYIRDDSLRQQLRDLKRSTNLSKAEVVGTAESLEAEMTAALATSPLPDAPDIAAVNAFLLDLRRRYWDGPPG
jgi:predicted nucleotidyltransferase